MVMSLTPEVAVIYLLSFLTNTTIFCNQIRFETLLAHDCVDRSPGTFLPDCNAFGNVLKI